MCVQIRNLERLSVNDMNIAVESFPSSIIAGIFGFKKGDLFESADNVRENVKVEF